MDEQTTFTTLPGSKEPVMRTLVSVRLGGEGGRVVNFVLFEGVGYTMTHDGWFRVWYIKGSDDREDEVCEVCSVSTLEHARKIVEWLDALHGEYVNACKECEVIN